MSGEVNMIPTLRKFRGGPVQANLGGASLETFSGEGQLKKSPCMKASLSIILVEKSAFKFKFHIFTALCRFWSFVHELLTMIFFLQITYFIQDDNIHMS